MSYFCFSGEIVGSSGLSHVCVIDDRLQHDVRLKGNIHKIQPKVDYLRTHNLAERILQKSSIFDEDLLNALKLVTEFTSFIAGPDLQHNHVYPDKTEYTKKRTFDHLNFDARQAIYHALHCLFMTMAGNIPQFTASKFNELTIGNPGNFLPSARRVQQMLLFEHYRPTYFEVDQSGCLHSQQDDNHRIGRDSGPRLVQL